MPSLPQCLTTDIFLYSREIVHALPGLSTVESYLSNFVMNLTLKIDVKAVSFQQKLSLSLSKSKTLA